MDDKMISEAGKYLKDISSQGFETYVQGVWASSLAYTLIGLLCLILIPFVYKYADKSIEKVKEKKSFLDDTNTGIFLIGWTIIGVLFVVGLLSIGFNIIGIFAPEYVAIKELISSVRG